MEDDILLWLRDEERRLRERIGAAHCSSEQYHVVAATNQANQFAWAARGFETLRSKVRGLIEKEPEE